MGRARGIGLALAVALALALWWSLERSAPRGTHPADPSTPASPEARAEPLADAATPEPPARREEPDVPTTAPAPTRDDGSGSAAPERTREVEVVDARSGRPVPDALLWIGPKNRRLHVLQEVRGPEPAPDARTDARGLARIPEVDPGELAVLAQAAQRAGFVVVPAWKEGQGRTRLELHPDWELVAEVVHADGTPAEGVPVAVSLTTVSGGQGSSYSTDASGRVRLAHVGLECLLFEARRLDLWPELPLREMDRRSVDLDAPPRAPVRFQLPALGSVQVRVEDLEGQPARNGTSVHLRLVPPGASRDASPLRRQEDVSVHARTRDGWALFPQVEPGMELEVRVDPSGGLSQRAYFPGPARPGERAEYTVVLGSDHPILEFRALDPQGVPMAGESLQVGVEMSTGGLSSSRSVTVVTDGEGRFRLDLEQLSGNDSRRLRAHAREESLLAELALDRSFPTGLVPQGDLRFQEAPLIVAGSVRDEAGQPVRRANVTVRFGVSAGRPDRWNWIRSRILQSDEAGEFRLVGAASGERLELQASTTGRKSAAREVPFGAIGVQLVLEGTGQIAGSVRTDERVPEKQLFVRAGPEGAVDARGQPSWLHSARIPGDGAFTLGDLPAGTYRVAVCVGNQSPIEVVTGVEVRSGAETRDARLDPLDLRGRLWVFELRLEAPHVRGPVRGNTLFGPAGTEPRERGYFSDSPTRLLATVPVIDVLLEAEGCRTVLLRGVDGDRTVRLEPALEVELVLPADVPLPEPPLYLKACLRNPDNEAGADYGVPAFDTSRRVRCRAPGTGAQRVQWILEHRTANGATAVPIEIGRPQTVTVEELEGQNFLLAVTAADVEAALDAADF